MYLCLMDRALVARGHPHSEVFASFWVFHQHVAPSLVNDCNHSFKSDLIIRRREKIEDLVEYQRQEEEQYSRSQNQVTNGHPGGYPFSRFGRLNYPVALRALDSPIWPQIPIFGSLVIPIYPVEARRFKEIHRFDIDDFDRLLDFWNDTGRVQFSLAAPAQHYLGLDYLDRLLTEVRPPLLMTIPTAPEDNSTFRKKLEVEFDTVASVAFWPFLKEMLEHQGFDSAYAGGRYYQLREAFVKMSLLGLAKTANRIMDCLVSDPMMAHETLYFNKKFVLNPIVDPLRAIPCYSLEEFRLMKEVDAQHVVDIKTAVFPNEIGAFLLKVLTLVPESFEASKNLVTFYKQEDLQTVVDALSRAVRESKIDAVMAKSSDLAAIFKNVWSDADKIAKRIRGVSHGITVVFGATGYAAGALLGGAAGGAVGFLAGMGLQVLDKSVDAFSVNVSERIAKATSRGSVSAVFDFKRKYRLINRA